MLQRQWPGIFSDATPRLPSLPPDRGYGNTKHPPTKTEVASVISRGLKSSGPGLNNSHKAICAPMWSAPAGEAADPRLEMPDLGWSMRWLEPSKCFASQGFRMFPQLGSGSKGLTAQLMEISLDRPGAIGTTGSTKARLGFNRVKREPWAFQVPGPAALGTKSAGAFIFTLDGRDLAIKPRHRARSRK